jgi:hypothetical protein
MTSTANLWCFMHFQIIRQEKNIHRSMLFVETRTHGTFLKGIIQSGDIPVVTLVSAICAFKPQIRKTWGKRVPSQAALHIRDKQDVTCRWRCCCFITQCGRVLLKCLTECCLSNTFTAFYEIWMAIIIFTLAPVMSETNRFHTLTLYLCKIYFNIIFIYTGYTYRFSSDPPHKLGVATFRHYVVFMLTA